MVRALVRRFPGERGGYFEENPGRRPYNRNVTVRGPPPECRPEGAWRLPRTGRENRVDLLDSWGGGPCARRAPLITRRRRTEATTPRGSRRATPGPGPPTGRPARAGNTPTSPDTKSWAS